VTKEHDTALGIHTSLHCYCRVFEVLLHIGRNLSEETEGLILQNTNMFIVLNKTFRGLVQSLMNSRETVNFIDCRLSECQGATGSACSIREGFHELRVTP